MPGFEAVYGYNLINISHYNNNLQEDNTFFNRPVLIKTIYYPTVSTDTLMGSPVSRNFYMISCYDEDSNKDGFINFKDLRKFYSFNIEGKNKRQLIPNNYAVMSSKYDHVNDLMYIFAKLDENNNGQMETLEPTHIFWIDLKNPERVGLQYGSK